MIFIYMYLKLQFEVITRKRDIGEYNSNFRNKKARTTHRK